METRLLNAPPAAPDNPADPIPSAPVAVIDMGASAIRLLVAETGPGDAVRILEEASRGLGSDRGGRGGLGRQRVTHG